MATPPSQPSDSSALTVYEPGLSSVGSMPSLLAETQSSVAQRVELRRLKPVRIGRRAILQFMCRCASRQSGFASLEAELQTAFGDIRKQVSDRGVVQVSPRRSVQVGLAHKAIESDLVRHLEQSHGSVEAADRFQPLSELHVLRRILFFTQVPSASPLLAAEVSPLDSWILKDTGITMTMTVSDTPGPKESTMSNLVCLILVQVSGS